VFLDQATNNVVRLKTGQDHQGWVLRSVKGREVTLEKNKRSATLALPVPTAISLGEAASMPVPPPVLPGPGRPSLPRPPGPAGATPPGAPPAHPTVGAPTVPIPGDTRPLADQL